MNKKEQSLRRRIQKIKTELDSLGDLRPGSLSKQFNVCGKIDCRCKTDPPKRHGPYYQLGWTRKRKSTTRFVRSQKLPEVRRQLKNYKRLQSLVDQWVDLSIQLCELNLRQVEKK
jgi:hypothetical protein